MTNKTDAELRKLCADHISFEESRVRMGVGNGNDVFADATHIARALLQRLDAPGPRLTVNFIDVVCELAGVLTEVDPSLLDQAAKAVWLLYNEAPEVRAQFDRLSAQPKETGKVEDWHKEADAYILAVEDAAKLFESVNPASDNERLRGDPGAGAMGAVLEYRDKIRALLKWPEPSPEKAEGETP